MLFPFNRISPEEGRSNPAIIRRVVVFPQPDGPRKVTNSPRFTVKEKSETALKPSLNVLNTFFNSMMFSLLFGMLLIPSVFLEHWRG